MKQFLLFISVFTSNYILAQNSVGIGTTSPNATLHVLRGTAPWGTAAFEGTTYFSHFNFGTTEDTYIRGGKAGSNVIINDLSGLGNVGIGTNAPAATLDVNGQVKISGGSPGAGKVLVSDATGIASWSNSSINTGAFAYSGGGTPQSISNGVSVVMAFPAVYLAGNNYSATDNSYTAPTAGFYHFDMQLTFRTLISFAGDKQLNIGFYVNGGPIWNPPYLLRNTTIDNTYQFSFSTQLAAGDKVTFHISQNTGATQQLFAGYFQGYRVY